MAAIERTDFSGGMVKDIAEWLSPANTVRTAQNVDLWSKKGSAKLIDSLVNIDNFPAGKFYDHHVIFPVQGDKDYAIIMMTDGTIYPYEPSGGFGSLIATVTAGSRMVYAGESVYVFYRAMSSPSLANTVRKRIYWDYDTSAFVVEDVIIENKGSNFLVSPIANGYGSGIEYFKSLITTVYGDGSESYGREIFGSIVLDQDLFIVVYMESGFDFGRLYLSLRADTTEQFLSPQIVYEFNRDSFFVPINTGRISGGYPSTEDEIHVYYELSGVDVSGFLSYLCADYLDSGTMFNVGNKIRVNDIEAEITAITDVVAGDKYYKITLDQDIPKFLILHTDDNEYALIEVEITPVTSGDNKVAWLPILRRYRDILGIQADENRPESKYTSGTGNVLAFASNKLFTANPYFPDVFEVGEDDDFKGFIAWNWITGEGKHAYSLIPNTQLISPTFSGSQIIDMFAFQDTLFILLNSGIARLKFENNNISFLQSDKYGVASRNKYYVDLGNMFISSGGRLYAGAIDKLNYETGAFDFVELGRFISSLLETLTDPRITYDNVRGIIYVCDVSDGTVYICSLRDEKPAWVGLVFTTTYKIYSGFKLNDTFYFVTYVSGGYRISQNGGSLNSNVVIEDKDVYIPMGNDFIRKVEVLYKKTSGTLNLKLYLDDTEIVSENLVNKTAIGYEEVRISRALKNRFDKIRWKIIGTTLAGFEFGGVFINRDVFSRETQRGY